jgi:hypothetical protein
MSQLQFASTTLESTTCATCGVIFALPDHMLRTRRHEHGEVFCPSGHRGVFGTSELDRLKSELQMARERLEAEQKTTEAMRKSAIAMRAQQTKLKNRIANGVCPCCNRSFINLGRHMGTKHPDYKTQDIG